MHPHPPPSYDVFLSYRHWPPESAWVRGYLAQRLRAAGLRVLVDIDSFFRLGAPIVTEMARAVEESRFTVAVSLPRTPQWVH